MAVVFCPGLYYEMPKIFSLAIVRSAVMCPYFFQAMVSGVLWRLYFGEWGLAALALSPRVRSAVTCKIFSVAIVVRRFLAIVFCPGLYYEMSKFFFDSTIRSDLSKFFRGDRRWASRGDRTSPNWGAPLRSAPRYYPQMGECVSFPAIVVGAGAAIAGGANNGPSL